MFMEPTEIRSLLVLKHSAMFACGEIDACHCWNVFSRMRYGRRVTNVRKLLNPSTFTYVGYC
jgi:hypothetical protein